ncbi:hypothetical protein NEMIN01_1993 [Nematocida minor]|uniref:uncharacterized protein n=1 Tax=Nematocida minor TaxID=1912983 RepID=UPI00221EF8A0|nr:uncharacterized protein NEMIN01_1993 [Nematocida minor]KAI5192406.1 hypothetical protein NEMIN01_1993 [Nematocida minor]
MAKEAASSNIKILVEKLNCTENQARNALQIARDDMAIAEVIIKEHRAEKRTSYVGGNSGQIVEMPKSGYAEEFEKLMKHSEMNQGEEAVGKRKFTIYKNGFLIDSKFTPLKEAEIKRTMENIFKNKELPSDLFNINQDDLIDVEVVDKSDEIYKEDYPGASRTVNLAIPTEAKSHIDLGGDSIVFKLTIEGKNTVVKMGDCPTFSLLKAYLEERGICGRLIYEEKEISWDENPANYKRTLLKLVQ